MKWPFVSRNRYDKTNRALAEFVELSEKRRVHIRALEKDARDKQFQEFNEALFRLADKVTSHDLGRVFQVSAPNPVIRCIVGSASRLDLDVRHELHKAFGDITVQGIQIARGDQNELRITLSTKLG